MGKTNRNAASEKRHRRSHTENITSSYFALSSNETPVSRNSLYLNGSSNQKDRISRFADQHKRRRVIQLSYAILSLILFPLITTTSAFKLSIAVPRGSINELEKDEKILENLVEEKDKIRMYGSNIKNNAIDDINNNIKRNLNAKSKDKENSRDYAIEVIIIEERYYDYYYKPKR